MSQIDENWLWHRRMRHINFDNLVKVSNKKAVRGMPKIIKPSNPVCKHYQLLELLHTHLGFFFPKIFPMFISLYPVS
jgi:hypothetical protein